jgi:hypothetical protein
MSVPPAALLTGELGISWAQCEQLLGEPILAADPIITTEQVTRLLGLDRDQVRRLNQQGWLRRYQCSATRRCYKLSDALWFLEPMTPGAAAETRGMQPLPPRRAGAGQAATSPDRCSSARSPPAAGTRWSRTSSTTTPTTCPSTICASGRAEASSVAPAEIGADPPSRGHR